MLNDTLITVEGWLGGGVTVRRAGDSQVATFRLAATPRRYNTGTGEWSDDVTQWYTVNAWRSLGRGCAASLRRGDPVVVSGRLRTTTWTDAAGVERSGLEIDASVVGHDLNRGTSVFTRTVRAAPEEVAAPTPSSPEQPVADAERGEEDAA